MVNGNRLAQVSSENGEAVDEGDSAQGYDGMENADDSFQMVDGGDDGYVDQVEEPVADDESDSESLPATKKGKGKAKEADPAEALVKKGRNQETKAPAQQMEEAEHPPAKRSRRSAENVQITKNKGGRPKNEHLNELEEEERPAKRSRKSPEVSDIPKNKGGRPRKAATTTNPTKSKGAGRKPDLTKIPENEAESPQVHRGPPMPRNNRGLLILRRETPMEGSGFKQTRSGRNSIKPLAYWRNERVEYSEDETEDMHGAFVLPRIKEVVRVDEVDEPKRVRSKSKAPKFKKRAVEPQSEEDVEPWEQEPGRIYGEVRSWDPEDQRSSRGGSAGPRP